MRCLIPLRENKWNPNLVGMFHCPKLIFHKLNNNNFKTWWSVTPLKSSMTNEDSLFFLNLSYSDNRVHQKGLVSHFLRHNPLLWKVAIWVISFSNHEAGWSTSSKGSRPLSIASHGVMSYQLPDPHQWERKVKAWSLLKSHSRAEDKKSQQGLSPFSNPEK